MDRKTGTAGPSGRSAVPLQVFRGRRMGPQSGRRRGAGIGQACGTPLEDATTKARVRPSLKGAPMLPLELRQEFRSAHMRGTAIELRNKQNTGWAQRDPAELLRMTY